MITIKCHQCRKEFQTYYGKFCSRQCYWKNKKGKYVYSTTQFKKGMKPWNTGKKLPQFSGKNAFAWKGGEIISWNGYVLIRSIQHPFVPKMGYMRRSRLVAENCLGRYLTKQEAIHHINGIKNDDRPENLYLFTLYEHKQYEALKNKPILTSNII